VKLVGARRPRAVTVTALAVGVVAVAAVAVWFQPQKLLIDERVDEALPGAAPVPPKATTAAEGTAATVAGQPATTAAPGPVVLASGELRSLGHTTSGRVAALRLADGRRFLRFDGLRTSNGPDLFVYLSVTPADGPRDTFDDEFVSLGRLKANEGSQNYAIPASLDLARYRSVVIWCKRFTYAFGAAPLR